MMSFVTIGETTLANTVKEAAVSAGATGTAGGSLLNAGQAVMGIATSTTHGMKAGIIPLIVTADVGVAVAPPTLADPPDDRLKNRYISIKPHGADGSNFGMDFDIRLTMTSTLVNGVTAVGSQWWANAPDAKCIAVVGPTRPAAAPNWDNCRTLHLTGCPVIPTSSYDVVAIAGTSESTPLAAATQAKPGDKWHGDVVGFFDGSEWTAPQGIINIDDTVAAIKTFQDPNAFNATHVSVTDVHPNQNGTQINRVVNIDDVYVLILGFKGQEYPGTEVELCRAP